MKRKRIEPFQIGGPLRWADLIEGTWSAQQETANGI
jgi:hypothetical protein